MSPSVRPTTILALLAFTLPLLAGCVAPTAPPCDATQLIRDGTSALGDLADPAGGIRPHGGADADPRTTAWALLAAGLARRTGIEGGFDPAPHLDHLKTHLDTLAEEGSPVDSAANNLSLARAAFQVWGSQASGIRIADPQHPDARTLEDAWETRYDHERGRYGVRLNEHLFGAFAAWIFAPAGERLDAMADTTVTLLDDNATDPTTKDAWWAAYARAALGPEPQGDAAELATRLESVLDEHQQEDGGVRGFASATAADASTTAAAILAWQRDGERLDGAHIGPAIDWLCTAQRDDGTIPFRPDQPILPAKTTAEVVIAVALVKQPIPWDSA